MGFLFWLLVVLAVIAVVGHTIWVVARAIVLAVIQPVADRALQPRPARVCPRCGEVWDEAHAAIRCVVCGWSTSRGVLPSRPDPARVLAHLRRRVEHYQRQGLIEPTLRDRLVGALQEPSPALARPVAQPALEPAAGTAPRPESTPAPAEKTKDIAFFDSLEIRPVPESKAEPVPKPVSPAEAVAERVRKVRAMREEAVSPEAPPAPPRSQRRFRLLTAFLEENNIRWGELVGGLLIVGCSIALVLSFWPSIAERPLLKFGLFHGMTALLFLLGFHVERRWKLPTTTRGLLIIAALLTPLNFLAVAALNRGPGVESAGVLVGEVVAVAIFAALMSRAGRTLAAGSPRALAVGVLVPSALLLVIRPYGAAGGAAMLLALTALPPLVQNGLTALVLRGRGGAEMGASSARDVLQFFGLSAFATLIAVGLVLGQNPPVLAMLHRLSWLAPLAGAPALATGLVVWRRTTARELAGYRTTGTALTALGVLVLLGGLALGWPTPSAMVVVALLDFAILTALATLCDLASVHALAGGCLMLAALLGWHAATGGLSWQEAASVETASALFSIRSGTVLVPIVLAMGAGAATARRLGRHIESQAYVVVALIGGLLSLGLASGYGFGRPGDPGGVTWVYASYGMAALVLAARGRGPILVDEGQETSETRTLGWIGSGLLLLALVQGFVFGGIVGGLTLPLIVALLAHSALATALPLALMGDDTNRAGRGAIVRPILHESAQVTSILAAAGLAAAIPFLAPSPLLGRMLVLAGVWLVLSWRSESAPLFAAFQAALSGVVVSGVATVMARQAWHAASPHPWLDPWTLQAQAIGLGVLGLGWTGLRVGFRALRDRSPAHADQFETVQHMVKHPWPAFDRIMRGVLVVVFVVLSVTPVAPGTAQELTPRRTAARLVHLDAPAPVVAARIVPPASVFELPIAPHGHAQGFASWVVLLVVLAALLAGQWERFRGRDLVVALGVAALAGPLIACRFEAGVAVASAWRWSSALVLLGLSGLIWCRGPLARRAARLGWPVETEAKGLVPAMTATLLTVSFLPLAAMAAYVGGAALLDRPMVPGVETLWGWTAVLFVILAGASLAARLAPTPFDGHHPGEDAADEGSPRGPISLVLLVLGVLPLLAVTVHAVGVALIGNAVVGPEPTSLFARIGNGGSYVPPIVLLAVVLIGHAARERSERFAFAGGLFLNLAATIGFLLASAGGGRPFDLVLSTRLAQLNAIVSSAYALAWMGAVTAWRRRRGIATAGPAGDLLVTTTLLGVALNLILWAWAALGVFLEPVPRPAPSPWLSAVGGPLGWAALALAVAAFVARARQEGRPIAPGWRALAAVAVALFLALNRAATDTGDWRTYHGLLAGQALAAMLIPLAAWHRHGLRLESVPETTRRTVIPWTVLALALTVLLALRALGGDPQGPWWTVAGLASMVPVAAALAGWSGSRTYLATAAILLNMAASIWWLDAPWPQRQASIAVDFINVNIIALSLPIPLWRMADRVIRKRPARGFDVGWHRIAAGLAVAVLVVVVAASLADDVLGGGSRPLPGLGGMALAAVAVGLVTNLRDERARASVAGLYAVGLCAAGWMLHQLQLPLEMLVLTGAVVLAAYGVATSYLWSRRDGLRAIGRRLGFPTAPEVAVGRDHHWIVPANLGLAAAVTGLAFGVVWTQPDGALRLLAGQAVLAQMLSIGLLARGERRSQLQLVSLCLGVVGLIAWSWAGITPGEPSELMDRLVAVLVALVGTSILYGLGPAKLLPAGGDWALAARRLVPHLLVLSASALGIVLVSEIGGGLGGREVVMSPSAVLAVGLALLGAVGAGLTAALVPGRDPLGLPERGRMGYVYACEAILLVLVAHLRLTMPWLFAGFLGRYWALIVMGVAFVGVGLSEVLRREGRLVLAEPLERSIPLLPLLPMIGALRSAPDPGQDTAFLLLTGALYTTIAWWRSRPGFGVLAILAYNAALGTVLGRWPGCGLLEHPQFWVIPPALCALIAAHLNRERLAEGQLVSIRYGAALAIYLSSTADVVLTGVAQAPWLPLVLGMLALLGVGAGILLRARGFLFLGLGFLSLALFTMIWHAAVDLRQTWIWWACGILVGLMILALVAVFERKRLEVLRLVEQLRDWEP